MKRDRYFHILRFLHFTENKNEPDMTDENSDWLWKMWNLFEILNQKFSKFYSPSEHLAIDEVSVLYNTLILNLGIRQRWVVNITHWPLYPCDSILMPIE